MKLIEFTLEGLPPSLNDQYEHTRFNTRLVDSVVEYRRKVVDIIRRSQTIHQVLMGLKEQPLLAEVDLESPIWLTRSGAIRRKDVDNMCKAFFDAIEESVWPRHGTRGIKRPFIGFRDQWIFRLVPEKVLGDFDRTTFRLHTHQARRATFAQTGAPR